jgi:hypothetical protein
VNVLMPELTLPELRQRLRKEQQKLRWLDQELDQKLIPESQRRTCEGSLLEFTNKRAWRWVEPSPFVSNWHIECMCEHFEAVAHRQILRLLINIPPRHSKSLGLNVFFPAWVWAQHPDGLDPDRALSGLGVGAKSRSGRPASRALDPARACVPGCGGN